MTALAALLVALNAVSFALFGLDKWKARRGAWRISERTLLLSGLVSGTVGAWLGVVVFRHKVSKPPFLAALEAAAAVVALVLVLVLRAG